MEESIIGVYPGKLGEIVDFFENFTEAERRENLIVYADGVRAYEPEEGEVFEYEDDHNDGECADTVVLYLKVNEEGRVWFKLKMGPNVQTLTKSMGAILCEGLNGVTLREVVGLDQRFVVKIVGGELVRLRSQSVYYILSRMKSACKRCLAKMG